MFKAKYSKRKTDIIFLLHVKRLLKISANQIINKMEHQIIDISEGYELSVNQINLWNIGKNNINNYYNQVILEVDKDLNFSCLKSALDLVVYKNETLKFKASVISESVLPVQIICNKQKKEFQKFVVESNQNFDLLRISETELGYNYDPLINEPLRLCWVEHEQANKNNFLIIRLFSLWADSYSTLFFCKELWKAVNQPEQYEKEKREVVEYKDFCAWQNQLFREPEDEGINFWKNYTAITSQKIIPFSKKTNSEFKPKRKTINVLEGDQYLDLKEKYNSSNTTLEYAILTKFVKYLAEFIKEEFVFGYLPHQRNYEELNNTFGLVSKTLPIKVKEVNDQAEEDICNSLKKSIEEIVTWSDYFYVDRVSSDDFGSNSVFKYIFEFIDLGISKEESTTGFNVKDIHSVIDIFDLKILGIDYGDRMEIELCYDKNKYLDNDIDLLFSQLEHCFSFNEEKDNVLSLLEKDIITKSNHTKEQFDSENSIIDFINKQAELFPNQTAISFNDKKITYKELVNKSNQFARYLIDEYKVAKGDPICILTDRSEWFVISVLGILKSGAYYVPIDASYPRKRVEYILKDCGCNILVSNLKSIKAYSSLKISVIDPSLASIYELEKNTKFVETTVHSDFAYCIYTSGSTGSPKGCLITHSNLLNYVLWANDFYFDDDNYGNWGLITSISFDLTVTSLFTSLTRGKKLWLGGDKKEIGDLLKESFNNPDIDILKLTPSHLSLIKELDIKETNIRTVICGGEQLTSDQLNALWDIKKGIRIFNEYGPTEATVGCVAKEMHRGEKKILIGKPIANTKINILNIKGEYCKIGVLGEIFITGHGLAKGYLNQSVLTKEKFITHPDKKEERLYRTGDLGRWLPDGNIEFMGRMDDQVKIRGYRIELEEIERVLSSKSSINSVVLLAKEIESGDKHLVAYYTSDTKQEISELRNYLQEYLPSYMIPSYFVPLEALPLTINGKIDKMALPNPNSKSLDKTRYVAPRTKKEEILVEIWKDVLGIEKIGINDDFFNVGGNSLQVFKMISLIQKKCNVKIEVKTFFENMSIAKLALVLNENKNKAVDEIVPVPYSEDGYEISNEQLRIWIASQTKSGSKAHHISADYGIEGNFDVTVFCDAIREIINRHEILRTFFSINTDGEIVQKVNEIIDLESIITTHSLAENTSDVKINISLEEFKNTDFDLSVGPLLKVLILQKSESEFTMSYLMHHIIGDFDSLEILTQEIMIMYNHLKEGVPCTLKKLNIHYKDYVSWIKKKLETDELSIHGDFFGNHLSTLSNKKNWIEKPVSDDFVGSSYNQFFDDYFVAKIRNFCKSKRVGILTLISSALAILVNKISGQNEVLFAMPMNLRSHPDLMDQVGLYLNVLPLNVSIDNYGSIDNLLGEVAVMQEDIMSASFYPFDKIVSDFENNKNFNLIDRIDIYLNIIHHSTVNNTQKEFDGFQFIPKSMKEEVSKFPFCIYVYESENEVSYKIEYQKALFSEKEIINFNKRFLMCLKELIEKQDTSIDKINLIDETIIPKFDF